MNVHFLHLSFQVVFQLQLLRFELALLFQMALLFRLPLFLSLRIDTVNVFAVLVLQMDDLLQIKLQTLTNAVSTAPPSEVANPNVLAVSVLHAFHLMLDVAHVRFRLLHFIVHNVVELLNLVCDLEKRSAMKQSTSCEVTSFMHVVVAVATALIQQSCEAHDFLVQLLAVHFVELIRRRLLLASFALVCLPLPAKRLVLSNNANGSAPLDCRGDLCVGWSCHLCALTASEERSHTLNQYCDLKNTFAKIKNIAEAEAMQLKKSSLVQKPPGLETFDFRVD